MTRRHAALALGLAAALTFAAPAPPHAMAESALPEAVAALKSLSRSADPAPPGVFDGLTMSQAFELMDELTATERLGLRIRVSEYRDLDLPGGLKTAIIARSALRRSNDNR